MEKIPQALVYEAWIAPTPASTFHIASGLELAVKLYGHLMGESADAESGDASGLGSV